MRAWQTLILVDIVGAVSICQVVHWFRFGVSVVPDVLLILEY